MSLQESQLVMYLYKFTNQILNNQKKELLTKMVQLSFKCEKFALYFLQCRKEDMQIFLRN